MSIHRHNAARDANEPEIVEALRKVGATVERLDKPLDLLVGYRGVNLIMEVKLPLGPRGGSKDRNLTSAQKRFTDQWRGQWVVVRSAEEAIQVLKGMRK